jgi:hypothetical protein
MKFTTELPDETIAGLLCSAFEGGSNYWYELVDYTTDSNRVPDYEGLTDPEKNIKWSIKDYEDSDSVGLYQLDRAKIQQGIQVMADEYPRHMADALSENHDAETGDVFLQCCLFGEVVYG